MNREPININNDDGHYKALKICHNKYIKDSDTHKASLSFPVGSTVATQYKADGPWIHGVTTEANSSDHNVRSYIVRVKNLQINNVQHKTNMQYPSNHRVVPLGSDLKRRWTLRGYFHGDKTSQVWQNISPTYNRPMDAYST